MIYYHKYYTDEIIEYFIQRMFVVNNSGCSALINEILADKSSTLLGQFALIQLLYDEITTDNLLYFFPDGDSVEVPFEIMRISIQFG